VKEGEYGGNIMYSFMKKEKRDLVKLFYHGGKRIKDNDDGGGEFNYDILYVLL
jgi:hypothetical protein